MGKPAATIGDQVIGLDTHVVLVPSPAGPIPTPLPAPFIGKLDEDGSTTVFADGKAFATVGTRATNQPSHIPTAGPFQNPPSNRGTISAGSSTLRVDGRAAARAGDPVTCCNDPSDQDTGRVVVASSTVLAG